MELGYIYNVAVTTLPNLHLQIYRPNVGTLNYVNIGKKTKKKPIT